MNTLSAMSESGAQMQHAEKIPIGSTLARRAVILLLAAFLIAYFIVAFVIGELKALWPRGRTSHSE
jgi:hypothetical protein